MESINQGNPALKIQNFTKFSTRVLSEINAVRANPRNYSIKLKKYKANIHENIIDINGFGIFISEGIECFDDAINFLNGIEELEKLAFSSGISKSADELLNLLTLHDGIPDMIEIEKTNYDLEKRMNHYGAAFGELDELIDYGTFDPEFVVVSFILCDGDPTRKERNIIFNPNVKYIGISSGLLPSDKVCTVINLAEYFYNPGELVPDHIINRYTTCLNYSGNSNVSRSINPSVNNNNPLKRKNSANLYNEKANKYKDYIKSENPNYNKYQYYGGNEGEDEDNMVNVTHNSHMYNNNYKNNNILFTAINENLSKIQINSEKKLENDDMNLPEGVEKIKYIEKPVKDKNSDKMKIIIKKITYYSDGHSDVSIYQKDK